MALVLLEGLEPLLLLGRRGILVVKVEMGR
jgi:hypothetical protein